MITEIRIRGLGVIEEAEVALGPGLTVVTGETGAGKTMVVSALGLLLGGRADAGAVRGSASGPGRAEVEGRFDMSGNAGAADRAADAGAELDDDQLIIARTVAGEGRSRAFLGGRSVPVGVLAELADLLVAVHGQSDQQRLQRPAQQRDLLDRFAGAAHLDALELHRAAFAQAREAAAALEEITTRARERAQEADLLRHGLAEIESVSPIPGEDRALAAEAARLGHADDLRRAAELGHGALLGTADDSGAETSDASSLVAQARRALEGVRHHDASLDGLAERLAEVSYLLADVGSDLASYAAGVDADPLRLEAVEQRRAALGSLLRKYGADVDEVLAWGERAANRLLDLDDDDRAAGLRQRLAALGADLERLGHQLTTQRRAAAERLSAAVTAELAHLALADARLTVAVEAAERSATGCDLVEFRLSAHRGAPERPLGLGASGGELSRVMLALEVVLAGADPVPTFVFDEVDAGVGGQAAVEVGARLARLAQTAQVLVVTHLPQVAAFADHHLLVAKSHDGAVTRSDVRALDDAGRVAELTRMLAGLSGSETGAAHARELLAEAAASKRPAAG